MTWRQIGIWISLAAFYAILATLTVFSVKDYRKDGKVAWWWPWWLQILILGRPVTQDEAWRKRNFISKSADRRSRRLLWVGVALIPTGFVWLLLTTVLGFGETWWDAAVVFCPSLAAWLVGVGLIGYRYTVWMHCFVRDDRVMPQKDESPR